MSDRKRLRERLKCKSFDWFIKNVYPDLFIPGEAIASGEVIATLTISYLYWKDFL